MLSSFTYTYRDATSVDRDLRQTVIDKSGAKTTYGYDGLDRLKRALTLSAGGATLSDYTYAYDPNSNRMSQTAPAGTTSYAYNTANELTQAGATTFAYDANGQETSSSAGRTFAYNARNQATSLRPAGAPSSTALGYLGEGQAELTAIGSDVVQNNQAGVGRLTTGGTAYSYTRDNDGRLISQRSTAGTYYYLFDALGSVVATTDSTGAVKNTYAYDPFGNSTASSTPVAGNPFQFASGYSTDGLYHFGQRYYDPNLGRWTAQDPLDQIGDLRQGNRYLYVGDDPINLVDPAGSFFADKIIKKVYHAGERFIFSDRLQTRSLHGAGALKILKGSFLANAAVTAANCGADVAGYDNPRGCDPVSNYLGGEDAY